MAENFFTGLIARQYLSLWGYLYQPAMVDPAVDVLTELARGGPALELGIGTGRLALPLSARGVDVHGIELSPDMVEQLGLQEGAEAVGATLGDFASAKVEGRGGSFSLAYVVRNTIMNLTTQGAQVDCFRNVAWHLEIGGHFVVEVMVPELRRLPLGTTVRPFTLEPSHLGFEEYDVATQGSVSHTSSNATAASRCGPRPSATSGPPSSTSWAASPALCYTSDGVIGTGPPSRARAAPPSPCGRRPRRPCRLRSRSRVPR